MAEYKIPCIHCGSFIMRDSRFCPTCQSSSPFGYVCPTCRKEVEKGQRICSGCGRNLYVSCPSCEMETFVQEKCEVCATTLMKKCSNKRCDEMQFFQNTKCTACGKKLKKHKCI